MILAKSTLTLEYQLQARSPFCMATGFFVCEFFFAETNQLTTPLFNETIANAVNLVEKALKNYFPTKS
jgi:hypothetical protein